MFLKKIVLYKRQEQNDTIVAEKSIVMAVIYKTGNHSLQTRIKHIKRTDKQRPRYRIAGDNIRAQARQ